MNSDQGKSTRLYSNDSRFFEAIQRKIYPDASMGKIINSELNPSDRVLSAMSGSRPLSEEIDAEVVGIDISREMIQLDQENKSVIGRVPPLPFEDNTFDGMYHLGLGMAYLDKEESEDLFEEAKRVLSSKSPLWVDYFLPESLSSIKQVQGPITLENGSQVERRNQIDEKDGYHEWKTTYRVWNNGEFMEIDGGLHKIREYHQDEINHILSEAGFSNIKSKPLNGVFDTVISDFDDYAYSVGQS